MFILNPSRFASAGGGGGTNGLLTGAYGYFAFEEASGTRFNSIAGGYDLSTVEGTPTNGAGKNGNALYCDPTPDSVSGLRDASLDVTEASCSVWVWFNSWRDHGIWSGEGLCIILGNNMLIDWPIRHDFTVDTLLPIGQWNHICATHSASRGSSKVFINGVLRSIKSETANYDAGWSNMTFGTQASRYLDGRVDEWFMATTLWTDGGADTVGDVAGGQVADLYSGLVLADFD